VGPQGGPGSQGIPGTPGSQGAQGDPGPAGPQGTQGGVGTPGEVGAQGAQGDVGAQGAQGDVGAQGPSVGAQSGVVTATALTAATASCDPGTFAIGGGGSAGTPDGTVAILSSAPVGGSPAAGWQATTTEGVPVTAYAICAS
jgi:hypothetical protein